MGGMNGDDLQLQGDLACENAEIRGALTVNGAPIASGVDVIDEGTPLGSFQTLRFLGAGVTATDAGSGVAAVTIPGASYPDITDNPGVQVAIGVQTQIVGATLYAPLGLDVGVSTAGAGGTIAAIGDPTINGNPMQMRSAVNVHPVTATPISGQGVDVDVALASQLVLRGNHQSIGASGTFNNVAVSDSSASFNAQGAGAGGLILTGMEPPLAWFAMVGATFSPNFLFFLANNGSGDLTIKHNDPGSLEYHRYYLPGSANIVIPASGGVVLRWGFSALAVGSSLGWTLVAKGI